MTALASVEITCPCCGVGLSLLPRRLKLDPKLAFQCGGCGANFAAAAAVLCSKARGIAQVGDVERPFVRPDVLARFATVWGDRD